MQITLEIKDRKHSADLSKPIEIAIPFISGKGPNAWYAPPYKSEPYADDNFVGSLESGAPVNFYNLNINPHGNGTHTESVLHIDKRGKTIKDTLKRQHFVAHLISVKPKTLENGDTIVDDIALNLKHLDFNSVNALIIRTMPNFTVKKNFDYSGTNPPYFSKSAMNAINATGIDHLLVDVPSVDREVDEGKLACHNIFWDTTGDIKAEKTITEMIYVDNNIEDGLYLLNLQIIPVDIDASPSNPVIYQLNAL